MNNQTQEALEMANRTPLKDLLRNVPKDGCDMYQHNPTSHQNIPYGRLIHEALAEIERLEALEQPAKEPVAWVWVLEHEGAYKIFASEIEANKFLVGYAPAVSGDVIVARRKVYGYTHPAQPLSDDEILDLSVKYGCHDPMKETHLVDFSRSIEQAHGIGEGV